MASLYDIWYNKAYEQETGLRQRVWIDYLQAEQKIYEEILEKGQCVSLKTLAVSGKDLIQAGMKPGKELGEKLGEFLEIVLDNPELNTKEALLARL